MSVPPRERPSPAPHRPSRIDDPRWGRAYFAVQALAGAAWWIGVFSVPGIREATLGGIAPVPMAALDLPLFVLASLLVALGVRAAVWVIAPWTILVALGMVAYATISGEAGWGALLMIASAVASSVAGCLVLWGRLPREIIARGPFAFRPASRTGRRSNLRRTGLQITVFWGLFLLLIPAAILPLEYRWGLHIEMPLAVRLGGAALLAAGSALGIWSAVSMSTRGEGTPLPSAMPRLLVVAGPYRFVRNPMAVAGIAQGVAVGLIAGSWLIVAYALCGSLVWNWIIRPVEEADLEERFGEEFMAYCARVRCWVPRLGRG
ncbi:methyltransferase family protein [Mycetocola spongiae]|uniref:methyltransferase family protein n=1 Tax=Mycetocola spongiae TaxID=2859226 RepID=UPI001CF1EFC8|nr:isoprenylcysteine carboxylmethyltransferase family protein [Mycetocola spongiae]UCR88150.1 isoprenylcysteine carboxylmethyltransferase family protein [Mycetocola spongiae]